MSQGEKARYYNALKGAGVTFSKHYREYNTAELKEAWQKLEAANAAYEQPAPESDGGDDTYDEQVASVAAEPQFDPAATAAAYAQLAQGEQPPRPATPREQQLFDAANGAPSALPRDDLGRMTDRPQPVAPVAPRDPHEMPGVRLNQPGGLQPIRTDEHGRVWFQEEVLKPAYPKPRGRRVLKYMETGVRKETVKDGKYVEEFEVAGDLPSRPAEVKITLPSYQVGIYKDPRFPFKIHTYSGRQGFDLFEVQNYYGGAELVPAEIKRIYVENVLCYDIRTTVRAIQTEYRQLQLQNRV